MNAVARLLPHQRAIIALAAFLAAAFVFPPAYSQGAKPAKVIVLTGTPQGSPSAPVYWIGKALGFQAQENVDAEVQTVPGGNVAQSAQLVASGGADAALMSPDTVLVPTSQGKDPGLVYIYNFYQRPSYQLVVSTDSGIKSVAQLRGKPVGIAARGNPAEPMLKAFLAEAHLTLDDVELQPVGVAVPAAQALKNHEIAALLAISPARAAWVAAGYSFTALPAPKIFQQLVGSGVAVARSSLQDPAKRDALTRFLRTWAESTVFVKADPEAAVKLDFAMFPQAKPRGLSDGDAVKQGMQAQAIVMADYDINVDGKWGFYRPEAFRNYVDYLGLSAKIPNVQNLWSNDLIADVNKFDATAIIAKAKSYQ